MTAGPLGLQQYVDDPSLSTQRRLATGDENSCRSVVVHMVNTCVHTNVSTYIDSRVSSAVHLQQLHQLIYI